MLLNIILKFFPKYAVVHSVCTNGETYKCQ